MISGCDPENCKGDIWINSKPLSSLDRYALRKRNIGITEQEPPLTEGSIRDNLTPVSYTHLDGVGARVDKVLARSARLEDRAMAVVDGQQNQDVHKQSFPLDLPKKGQVYFGRLYQAKRYKNAGLRDG